jgi:hypothetical protein
MLTQRDSGERPGPSGRRQADSRQEGGTMTEELLRIVVLAVASSTVAVVVVEGLRRRVAGTRFDRQLREQHP